ncbi:LysE family translocator [Dactylosporangium vinaceum]|uniref:LysE family translocator n=1 Tax=Dactylosporangium vinaceum TaxID=53362 RepID=A0ABV5MS91_9ACTN|nr:LysE family translocator [Dactylosporangium vinaceum]
MLLKFATVSALLTVIPGPNALLVARNALVARALALAAAAGTAAGALTWGIAASIGLATLLHRSSQLYEAVKLLGAAYLIYLGAAAIWSTVRHRRNGADEAAPLAPEPVEDGAPPARRSPAAAFRAGFVSDVLNPKTGVFYAAIVPQLLPDSFPVFTGTMLFATVDALVTLSWFAIVSLLVARLSGLLTARVIRIAERCTGTVLIALGIRTAVAEA